MKFIFKARMADGTLKEGLIEAGSQDSAVSLIQKNGLFLVNIKEQKEEGAWKKDILKALERVTEKEQVIFFRQLATLVGARVPIISALSAIGEQNENPFLRRVLREVSQDIEDGTPFSDALEKQKDVFSKLTISIIRAGEASGNLKKSVEYIADNIEKNYELTSRVRGAMMYPAIILIVFTIVGFLVMTFVVPNLLNMVKELQVEIPWHTGVLISISSFFASYWWALLIMFGGFLGGLYYYINTEEGKPEWDKIKIKFPVAGRIYKNVYVTRFAENLSVLLASGIPIIRALNTVSSVTGNAVYEKIFLSASDELKVGGNMSDVLKKYPNQIPPIVVQMIRIGEESGQTDAVLHDIASFYERETENMTKNLTTLIEPIMIVIMGVAVGLLAISVLSPIYQVAGQIQ